MSKDASSYQPLHLSRLQKASDPFFEELDFSKVSIQHINELFPVIDKFGKLDPPLSERTSAEKLRQWRELGKSDQQYKLENALAVTQSMDDPSQRRGRRRKQHEDVAGQDQFLLQNRLSTHSESPQAKGMTTPQQDDVPPHLPPPLQTKKNPGIYPWQLDGCNLFQDDTVCTGVGKECMEEKVIRDIETVDKGFHHLVGNAIRYKASFVSRSKEWTHGKEVVGFLVNPACKNDEEAVNWICYETEEGGAYYFRHATCSSLGGKTGRCISCEKNAKELFKLCRNQAEKREDGLNDKGRTSYLIYESPSLVIPLLQSKGQEIKILRRQIYERERVRKKMKAREIEVPNMDSAFLFNEHELKNAYQRLIKTDEVSERQLFDYIFQECLVVAKRVKETGSAKGHTYSDLYIQFACGLRASQTNSKYDFYAKVFNLPTGRTLQEYSNADSTSADGLMYETLIQQTETMKKHLQSHDKDIDEPFRWYGSLAFDSHTIRGKLGFCKQTGELVGYADDAFNLDVIIEKFKSVAETEDDSSTKTKDDELKLGKHFMVFMFTTWTNQGHAMHFMAARYCLASLSARWLVVTILKIIAALAYFGFIVNALGFDGATENRSAIKQLVTLTVEQLFPDLKAAESQWNSDNDALDGAGASSVGDRYGKHDLPWKLKIAFPHPTVPGVNVFAGGDMPHGCKKTVNNLENSGKKDHDRELTMNGRPLSLQMLHDVWLQSPDSKDESEAGCNVQVARKLTREHFEKNACNRMRSPLAFGVTSQTMLRLIRTYKTSVPKAGVGTYDSMELLIIQFDRFIDVMNGKKEKNCSNISSADHPHVYELLDFVKFLQGWKIQAGDNKQLFIAVSTWEDLNWTAFSIIGIARTQLPVGHSLVQKRHGSDCCEKAFCLKRNKNVNADAMGTRSIMAGNNSNNMMSFAGSRKANTGKERTYRGQELGAPVGKRKRLQVPE